LVGLGLFVSLLLQDFTQRALADCVLIQEVFGHLEAPRLALLAELVARNVADAHPARPEGRRGLVEEPNDDALFGFEFGDRCEGCHALALVAAFRTAAHFFSGEVALHELAPFAVLVDAPELLRALAVDGVNDER
jgi:hypothetical protein